MKKYFFLLLTCLPFLSYAQKAVINGSVNNLGMPIPYIYYTYRLSDSTVNDSVKVQDKKYSFSVEGEMPVLVTLLATAPDPNERIAEKNTAIIFVQSGVNTVTSVDSFSNVQVKESIAHAEFVKINTSLAPYNKQVTELMSAYQVATAKKDTASMKKLQKDYEVINSNINNVYGTYVKANPSSPIVLFALNGYAGYDIDPVKVSPLYNGLSEKLKNSTSGKKLADRIKKAEATAVGVMAPDFTLADTSGKQVSLASFKGKYVLVDFWASWCGPCRRENPNVVNAFNTYKDKNFTILGVSLDDMEGKEKWLAAIQKDKLAWTQVSDLQGWDNAAAKLYGIQGIPKNFLLDPTGKIIAKNLRGEELDNKLKELIK